MESINSRLVLGQFNTTLYLHWEKLTGISIRIYIHVNIYVYINKRTYIHIYI